MIDNKLSKNIFDELINGKVINANMIGQDDKPYVNPLFQELISNIDEYTAHFDRCGKSLAKSSQYFMLREESAGAKTDVTIKISVLLLMLGKYMNIKGWNINKLMDSEAGITEVELTEVGVVEEGIALELMKKADIKGDVTTAYNRVLVDRGIMYKKPISKKYVLTDSGKAFFSDIFNNFKEGMN